MGKQIGTKGQPVKIKTATMHSSVSPKNLKFPVIKSGCEYSEQHKMAIESVADQLVRTSNKLKKYVREFESNMLDLMKSMWQPMANKLEEIINSLQQVVQISATAHDMAVLSQVGIKHLLQFEKRSKDFFLMMENSKKIRGFKFRGLPEGEVEGSDLYSFMKT